GDRKKSNHEGWDVGWLQRVTEEQRREKEEDEKERSGEGGRAGRRNENNRYCRNRKARPIGPCSIRGVANQNAYYVAGRPAN
ncbi:hypothetical protein K0M31_003471, partial [Melipona bicolor]